MTVAIVEEVKMESFDSQWYTIGSSQLVYYTEEDQTGNKYGVYKCVVNNTVIEIVSSVHLKEEG